MTISTHPFRHIIDWKKKNNYLGIYYLKMNANALWKCQNKVKYLKFNFIFCVGEKKSQAL